MCRVDPMIEIMDARELVSILKEKYGNCTHYKDRGRRISLRGGERREMEFTTRYYSPDRFHYQETEGGKETLDIRFRKGLARTREEVEELSPLLENWAEKVPWILQRPYYSLKKKDRRSRTNRSHRSNLPKACNGKALSRRQAALGFVESVVSTQHLC